MIANALTTITEMYTESKDEPFKQHPLADYIRDEAKREIETTLNSPTMIVKGSAGQGRWADVPWIAIFDPVVTESATHGYYLVYLFSADMERIYLCLGQGTTAVRQEFGSGTIEELERRAALIRARLSDLPHGLSDGEVVLHGSSQLAEDYPHAVALHFEYKSMRLPDESELTADLHDALGLYLKLTARGGLGTFEDEPQTPLKSGTAEELKERKRYRYHRKIERNSKAGVAAKRVHGYTCQACDFNFEEFYGQIGAEYIEAHHLTPLAELPEGKEVSLDPRNDFAVLCANCHRMVHRKASPNSLEELKRIIDSNH